MSKLLSITPHVFPNRNRYNRVMRVTVGVSGGIAAYKAAELVRALQRQAIEVHVVMTEAAGKFVQPLTFAALTGHKVITSLWDDAGTGAYDSAIEHIGEAQWADALVVAPATANILAKFAHGIADDFLTTLYLATTAPVFVAPAMNMNMWEHLATQENLETLRQRGVRIIEPGTGELAAWPSLPPLPKPCSAHWAAATIWPAKLC
jgi:phosphopantothenoylcysteine decarboxylase/phosphopantothenate--cysteine ligase